jgi:hypothetical protein
MPGKLEDTLYVRVSREATRKIERAMAEEQRRRPTAAVSKAEMVRIMIDRWPHGATP